MPGKRMAGILAAAAFIILAIYLVPDDKGGETMKTASSDRVTVTNLTENSGTDRLTLDIQIPRLSGFKDKGFEKDLNLRIKARVDTARDAAEEAADEFWRQAREEDYEPWPYTFYAEYEVKSDEAILSLRVTTLLYTGGTGMPQTVYYNVDIMKNELITLSGLFKNEDYIQIINSVILDEMDKDIERYIYLDEFPGVSKHTKFFISEGKLYIGFAKYEIASGMTGEPEFLIPAERIRGILKKEYAGLFK
jgi:hypothetical protein